MLDQYAQMEPMPLNVAASPAVSLQAQVLPSVIELKWENKVLRVPNPEHVRQLAQTCAQQAVEIQQLKDKQISMQNHIQQMQRAIQQLQNMMVG